MIYEILKTPLYNRFYYDFLSADKKVSDFLVHPNFAEWEKICVSIEPDSHIHRSLKEILIKQNGDLSAERARKNLAELKNKNSTIVITGQQLGLFASPMYTIYKALTTVQLSDTLNRKYSQYSFVPVFWLESEDHDFDEVNHFGIWNSIFEPQIITYRGENRGKVPLRHYNYSADVDLMLSQIENGLQKSDFTMEVLEQIRRSCTQGSSWLEGTRDFLKSFFESSGLLFFQPGATEVKEISVEFLKGFLEESKDIRQAFSSVSSKLTALGYDNQVTDLPGKTYIHIEDEHLQRMHLYSEDKVFFLKESGKNFTYQEIFDFVRKYPEKISTAVASRPVLQSWLFPVAAYVAGPAEIAYWAQLGGIFKQMQIQMPVIYPRISATLIEPKIFRYLEKHMPDIQHIEKKSADFIDNYFKKALNKMAENPFNKANSQIDKLLTQIKNYLLQLDATLGNTVDKSNERIRQQIEQLEQRSVKAKEQKEQLLLSHLKQIHSAFFPDGMPQERFVSPVYFLNKFGKDFMHSLFQSLSSENWNHQIVSIGLK